MLINSRTFFGLALVAFMLTACRPSGSVSERRLPTDTTVIELEASPRLTPSAHQERDAQATTVKKTPILATPGSQEPAAGICGHFEGQLVTITIYPDVPEPRCVIITPDQMLRVLNSRQETLEVRLGSFESSIEPGSGYTFPAPFGEYLAPGVHNMQVLPCCGAELWLQEDPLPTPGIEGTLSPESELALQALTAFFSHLNAGRYEQAADLYGGTYNIMLDHNPEIDPDDQAALFRNACTINGAQCLKISNAKLWIQPTPTEFRFAVEFKEEDGSLFTRGPCCGDTDTHRPHQKEFIYTVRQEPGGNYVVLEMPVYTP